jgi:hypothetical protein
MMAIHISDPETIALVERLAETLGSNKTAAINRGMREALESRCQSTTVEGPKLRGGLKAELDARLRRETKDYVRLREAVSGSKSGSRIYVMLNRHGPVETVKRLMMGGPSEGLRFLAEHDRIDLAVENFVLDPAYENLFPAEVKVRAQENLDYARTIVQRPKP